MNVTVVSVGLVTGTCSDTLASDGRYVMENNFSYSKTLYEFCARSKSE